MVPMSLDLTPLFTPMLAIGIGLFLAAAGGLAVSALHGLSNPSAGGTLANPEPQPA